MFETPLDAIIDLSQPGVVHYVYPTGKKVPDHMMDPNIGGYHGDKDKTERQDVK